MNLELLALLIADYDHPWPNEDAGTTGHRLRILEQLREQLKTQDDSSVVNWLEDKKTPVKQIIVDNDGKVSIIYPFHYTLVSGATNLRVAAAKAIEKEKEL